MKLSKMQQLILIELFIFALLLGVYTEQNSKDSSDILSTSSNKVYRLISEEEGKISHAPQSSDSEEKNFIKWIDFNVTKEAMQDAYAYDVKTYGQKIHLDWISLLACQACKNGGDFSRYKPGDMAEFAEKLITGETDMEILTKDMKYYDYYCEAYAAVLGGLVGEYEVETSPKTAVTSSDNSKCFEKRYGLKGFLPLAKNFPYSDYDDFGVSRSYGYKRQHLGHDMMGQIGTPI